MPRFFLPDAFCYSPGDPLPAEIRLEGEDAFHLSVSQRARIGDEVTLCTASGVELRSRIASISGGKKAPLVTLTPVSAAPCDREMPVSVTVFQGVPKGKKTDSIIQKCTELGADRIVLVYTDRCVPTPSDETKKTERFERIAHEACKQCGRGKLVSVSVLPSLDEAIVQMKESKLAFACYEEEGERSIKDLIRTPHESAAFLIGPEGGLSPREVLLLEDNGIPTVTLGKRILRTETAATAVLSMYLFEKEL